MAPPTSARSTFGTRESASRRTHNKSIFGMNSSRFFSRLSVCHAIYCFDSSSANFLCGHVAPILMKNQLRNHSLFGLNERDLDIRNLEIELVADVGNNSALGLPVGAP